ncbi:uncharacterized protein LOC136036255 isoform X3 [Artemia franciscana]|uniref:uncharacterized protein LOC136036255 isoform X3 n=1 Tax=Artemia franciscana TaxID=6661 RepID=UPI0032DB321A
MFKDSLCCENKTLPRGNRLNYDFPKFTNSLTRPNKTVRISSNSSDSGIEDATFFSTKDLEYLTKLCEKYIGDKNPPEGQRISPAISKDELLFVGTEFLSNKTNRFYTRLKLSQWMKTKEPVFITVNPGSKAEREGVREGDLVKTINDYKAEGITNSKAHSLLRESGSSLKLGLLTGGSVSRKSQKKGITKSSNDQVSNIAEMKESKEKEKIQKRDELGLQDDSKDNLIEGSFGSLANLEGQRESSIDRNSRAKKVTFRKSLGKVEIESSEEDDIHIALKIKPRNIIPQDAVNENVQKSKNIDDLIPKYPPVKGKSRTELQATTEGISHILSDIESQLRSDDIKQQAQPAIAIPVCCNTHQYQCVTRGFYTLPHMAPAFVPPPLPMYAPSHNFSCQQCPYGQQPLSILCPPTCQERFVAPMPPTAWYPAHMPAISAPMQKEDIGSSESPSETGERGMADGGEVSSKSGNQNGLSIDELTEFLKLLDSIKQESETDEQKIENSNSTCQTDMTREIHCNYEDTEKSDIEEYDNVLSKEECPAPKKRTPIYFPRRFLDVIPEEGSDVSDFEIRSSRDFSDTLSDVLSNRGSIALESLSEEDEETLDGHLLETRKPLFSPTKSFLSEGESDAIQFEEESIRLSEISNCEAGSSFDALEYPSEDENEKTITIEEIKTRYEPTPQPRLSLINKEVFDIDTNSSCCSTAYNKLKEAFDSYIKSEHNYSIDISSKSGFVRAEPIIIENSDESDAYSVASETFNDVSPSDLMTHLDKLCQNGPDRRSLLLSEIPKPVAELSGFREDVEEKAGIVSNRDSEDVLLPLPVVTLTNDSSETGIGDEGESGIIRSQTKQFDDDMSLPNEPVKSSASDRRSFTKLFNFGKDKIKESNERSVFSFSKMFKNNSCNEAQSGDNNKVIEKPDFENAGPNNDNDHKNDKISKSDYDNKKDIGQNVQNTTNPCRVVYNRMQALKRNFLGKEVDEVSIRELPLHQDKANKEIETILSSNTKESKDQLSEFCQKLNEEKEEQKTSTIFKEIPNELQFPQESKELAYGHSVAVDSPGNASNSLTTLPSNNETEEYCPSEKINDTQTTTHEHSIDYSKLETSTADVYTLNHLPGLQDTSKDSSPVSLCRDQPSTELPRRFIDASCESIDSRSMTPCTVIEVPIVKGQEETKIFTTFSKAKQSNFALTKSKSFGSPYPSLSPQPVRKPTSFDDMTKNENIEKSNKMDCLSHKNVVSELRKFWQEQERAVILKKPETKLKWEDSIKVPPPVLNNYKKFHDTESHFLLAANALAPASSGSKVQDVDPNFAFNLQEIKTPSTLTDKYKESSIKDGELIEVSNQNSGNDSFIITENNFGNINLSSENRRTLSMSESFSKTVKFSSDSQIPKPPPRLSSTEVIKRFRFGAFSPPAVRRRNFALQRNASAPSVPSNGLIEDRIGNKCFEFENIYYSDLDFSSAENSPLPPVRPNSPSSDPDEKELILFNRLCQNFSPVTNLNSSSHNHSRHNSRITCEDINQSFIGTQQYFEREEIYTQIPPPVPPPPVEDIINQRTPAHSRQTSISSITTLEGSFYSDGRISPLRSGGLNPALKSPPPPPRRSLPQNIFFGSNFPSDSSESGSMFGSLPRTHKKENSRLKAALLSDWLKTTKQEMRLSTSSGSSKSRPVSLEADEAIRQSLYEDYRCKTNSERNLNKVNKFDSELPRSTNCLTPLEEWETNLTLSELDQEAQKLLPGSTLLTSPLTSRRSRKGVWSPGQSHTPPDTNKTEEQNNKRNETQDPIEPVWTPSRLRSPSLERKEFRPVKLDTNSLPRQRSTEFSPGTPSSGSFPIRSTNTPSSPTSHLPRSQNPTVTLLQRAREGQLPKGAAYLEPKKEDSAPYRNNFEPLYTIKREYDSEEEGKRIIELTPKKYQGVGPVIGEGIPVALRNNVEDESKHQWYRRMYDTLHKQPRQGNRYPYRPSGGRGVSNGYVSEPELQNVDYDSDAGSSRYGTLDRRRSRGASREVDIQRNTSPIYKNQPGRIEDYVPGKSSVSEKELEQQRFQAPSSAHRGGRYQPPSNSFTAYALKESGYESDSQLFFRKRNDGGIQTPTSDNKEARYLYKEIQKGGEVPLCGLRKSLPEKHGVAYSSEESLVRQRREFIRRNNTSYPGSRASLFFVNPSRPPPYINPPPAPPSLVRYSKSFRRYNNRKNQFVMAESSEWRSPSPSLSFPDFGKDLPQRTFSPIIPDIPFIDESEPEIFFNSSVGETTPNGRNMESILVFGNNLKPEAKNEIAKDSKTINHVSNDEIQIMLQKRREKIELDLISQQIQECIQEVRDNNEDQKITIATNAPLSSSKESMCDRPNEKKKTIQIIVTYSPKATEILGRGKETNLNSLCGKSNILKPSKSFDDLINSKTLDKEFREMLEESEKKEKQPEVSDNQKYIKRGTTLIETNIDDIFNLENLEDKPKTVIAASMTEIPISKGEKHEYIELEGTKETIKNIKVRDSTSDAPSTFVKSYLPLGKSGRLNAKSDPCLNSFLMGKKPVSESVFLRNSFSKDDSSAQNLQQPSSRDVSPARVSKKLELVIKKLQAKASREEKCTKDKTKNSEAQTKDDIHISKYGKPKNDETMKHKVLLYHSLKEPYEHKVRMQIPFERNQNFVKSHEYAPNHELKEKQKDDFIFQNSKKDCDSWSEAGKEILTRKGFEIIQDRIEPEKLSKDFLSPHYFRSSKMFANDLGKKNQEQNRVKEMVLQTESSPPCKNSKVIPARNEFPFGKKKFNTVPTSVVKPSRRDSLYSLLSRCSTNVSPLPKNSEEYKQYIIQLRQTGRKDDKFSKLQTLYSNLEKMCNLEKAASCSDLHCLNSDGIIDFESWSRMRKKEKAENELKDIKTQIWKSQDEKEIFVFARDVNRLRWKGDSSLRMKDNSVSELREQLETNPTNYLGLEPKTLRKNELKDVCSMLEKSITKSKYVSSFGLRSSLSSDQVSSLKDRLNEVYSNAFKPDKKQKDSEIPGCANVDYDSSKNKGEMDILRDFHNNFQLVLEKECKQGTGFVNYFPNNFEMTEAEKNELSKSLSQELNRKLSMKYGGSRAVSNIQNLRYVLRKQSSHKELDNHESSSKSKSQHLQDINSPKKSGENTYVANASVRTFPIDGLFQPHYIPEKSVSSVDLLDRTIFSSPTSETRKVTPLSSRKTSPVRNFSPRSRRARSMSPGNTSTYQDSKYNRSYLNIVKVGDVEKLKNKFSDSRPIHFGTFPRMKINTSMKEAQEEIIEPKSTTTYSKVVIKNHEVADLKWIKSRIDKKNSENKAKCQHDVDSAQIPPSSGKSTPIDIARRSSGDKVKPSPIAVNQATRSSDRSCAKNLSNGTKLEKLTPNGFYIPGKLGLSHVNAEQLFKSKTNDIIGSTASAPPSLDDSIQKTLCKTEVQRLCQDYEKKTQKLSLMGQIFTSTPTINELESFQPLMKKLKPFSSTTRGQLDDTLKKCKSYVSNIDVKLEKIKNKVSDSCHRSKKKARKEELPKIYAYDPTIHRPAYRYTPKPPEFEIPARPPLPLEEVIPCSEMFKSFLNAARPRPPARSTSKAAGGNYHFDEREITLGYKTAVRNLRTPTEGGPYGDLPGDNADDPAVEAVLRERQAEHMRRVYEESKRKKHLKELEDIEMRRHGDNLLPSQKSPVPLNRYDNFMEDSPRGKSRDRTPEPKVVARALYNFFPQSPRELALQKGDIVIIRRQIDKNWYEGDHNAAIGIFPVNYVEIIPYDSIRATANKRPTETRAKVKYNFVAQSPMELSLIKGETVIVIRKVDNNWFEGRIGQRKGIFPVAYVEPFNEPEELRLVVPQRYTQSLSTSSTHSKTIRPNAPSQHLLRPVSTQVHNYGSYGSLRRGGTPKAVESSPAPPPVETVYQETEQNPVTYRAMYAYKPQNDDELELLEGDIVSVIEKCDDGWYVGTSQRSGHFGTFPGNYVERL